MPSPSAIPAPSDPSASSPGLAPAPERLVLSELIGSLSHALDLTSGQPRGHCVRACWIGMNIGRQMGLHEASLRDLYYTVLLKDLGCSSNAARICELYLTDDLCFKRDFKAVGDSWPRMLRFVFSHTGSSHSGRKAGLPARLRSLLHVLRNEAQIADELFRTRSTRGAALARKLRLGETVAQGIADLDEHWDGNGRPQRRQGDAIALPARIALLAQVVEVHHAAGHAPLAIHEARSRAGTWFDPALVAAFDHVALDPMFWHRLASPALEARVAAMAPASARVVVSDDHLDDIAEAFGEVVDGKSLFTAGHSARVAASVDGIGIQLGLAPARRRWLRRGALLHDMGKLGVSNTVLDKPGKLDSTEWAAVQQHVLHTEAILSRVGAFGHLGRMAAAHHERLDGTGYPRGLKAPQIPLETRIITAADIFDALCASRPQRAAMPVAQALTVMAASVGTAIDPACFEALQRVVA
ncbi:HD domain-containing phosphohydrolase [Variovorax sp. H27-G14]|uniref:HD-GYP domain-containing protein n=1 Tax=Variovorax sp. H27-G14 TaxID=3111914 RepID=UPI0038FCDDD4